MRTIKLTQTLSIPGGGFIAAHFRREEGSQQWLLQITIARKGTWSEPINYADVDVSISSLENSIVPIPHHPPAFIVVENQECGLYEVPLGLIEIVGRTTVIYAGNSYKFSVTSETRV